MGKLTKTEKSWILYDWANSVYATIIMAAVYPIYFAGAAKAAGFSGDVWWGYAVSYIGFTGANLFYDSFLTDVTTTDRMDRISAYGYAMGYIGGSTIPFLISIALILFGKHFGVDGTLAVKLSVILTVLWWCLFSIPILRNVKQTHYVETPPAKLAAGALSNLRRTVRDILRNRKLLLFMIAYFFYIDGVGTVITMSTSYGSTLGLGSTGMILALLVTQLLAVPFSILFGRAAEKIGSLRMLQAGVLVYMVICLLGFYMGFSLEPHQKAYENAFQQTVDSARAELPAETLARISAEGKSVLAAPDRVQQFDRKLDEISAGADAAERAGLEKLRARADAFLSDAAQARGYTDALAFSTKLFWALAVLVSTAQGGIQALSRSFFGKLIPPERSNEHFGFFDIFGKFASVMGPALYAFFAAATGRSSIGILSLLLLFGIGFFALSASKRHFADPESGK